MSHSHWLTLGANGVPLTHQPSPDQVQHKSYLLGQIVFQERMRPESPSPAPIDIGDLDAEDLFSISVILEAAALAFGAGYFLWGTVPHNALAVVAGIAVITGYVWGVMKKQTVYWMLLPRMVMWGAAIAMAISFVSSHMFDYKLNFLWQALSGVVAAALVFWNACLARNKLSHKAESLDLGASFADLILFVFVALEATAVAFGAGYLFWNDMASVPYHAIPLAIGAVLGSGYFWAFTRKQTIYWMLLPRMVMWSVGIAWVIVPASGYFQVSVDTGWQVFGACAICILIFWNACLAKRQLDWLNKPTKVQIRSPHST